MTTLGALEQMIGKRLPMIHQNEIAECGLASLAMVAAYHGHRLDMNGLRQRFALSLKGATLDDLMRVADVLGFSTRALRAEMEHLPELAAPCILHWDLNHFVVLREVKGDKIHIHDPARGHRVLSEKEVSKHFSGVVLEITPAADFAPKEIRLGARLSDLWSKLTGWKRSLAQTLLLSLMLQVFVLASPFYLQLAIDEAVSRYDLQLLLVLALGFGAMFILQSITEGLRAWVILVLGQTMSFQMVGNVFRHLMRLPTAYFEKRFVGDVLSRMASTRPIQEMLTQGVVAALIDGLMAIATGALIFIYSPVLGFIVAGSTLLYVGVALILYPMRRMREEEQLMARAEEQSHLIESIRASTTIKLFGREVEREAVWRNYFARVINAGVSVGRFDVILQSAKTAIYGLQMVAVVYVGARMILAEQFTIGMLFAVLAYRANFVERAGMLVERGTEFRLLSLHLMRLADIVKAEKEEPAGAQRDDETFTGDIELVNLKFRYAENEPWIFENVSAHIRAGEFIAIVGPSGGGKTTLLKTMLGLYPTDAGQIKLGGRALSSFGVRRYRSMIGVVQQDDELFAGTLADNISFFDPQIDMERVYQCARDAKVYDEIMEAPMGFLGLVGDMGSTLSGGQRQRVLLARALYRQPKALFLDEGTANLDPDVEAAIVEVIGAMKITRVVVAHRPALVERADRVFEMRDGRLSEITADRAKNVHVAE